MGNRAIDLWAILNDLKRRVGILERRTPPSGGGGGAVTSVNTQTGVVVLGAADVGADPAGSAAAAQAAAEAASVPKSLYDANGLLISVTDNTPVFKAVAASRILGRKATGDVDDMTTAELAALFGTPDGTKFLADDGTLKVPSGGSGSGLDPFLLMGG